MTNKQQLKKQVIAALALTGLCTPAFAISTANFVVINTAAVANQARMNGERGTCRKGVPVQAYRSCVIRPLHSAGWFLWWSWPAETEKERRSSCTTQLYEDAGKCNYYGEKINAK